MQKIITDQQMQTIANKLNDLPIRCLATAQEIIGILNGLEVLKAEELKLSEENANS